MTDTTQRIAIVWDQSTDAEFVHPELQAALLEAAATPGGAAGAERLRVYWTEGEGAAKIRWGVPGDFMRCVHHLEKYVADPKGYCSDMHQRATGARPGHAPSEQKAGAMSELLNVEIARVGQWNLKSGTLNVTPEMLTAAAAYGARPDARPSPIKLGHGDPRFDGEPALGWLSNLRVEGTGADSVLIGDIHDMPAWLAAAAPKHWPERSMEGWTDFTASDGQTYAMVVDGLALLGVSPPGMKSLRSLRDLPMALGVAASSRMVATAPHEPPDAPADGSTQTEGRSAVAFSDEQINNLRATLQLPEDADEAAIIEAVGAVVDESLEERQQVTPPQGAVSTPAPATPAAPAPTTQEAPVVQVAATAGAPGTMVIDSDAWNAREQSIQRLEAAEARRRTEERDQILAGAVQAGKFGPARVEHWKRLWDADPEGTREVVAGLTPNVVPVEAMGELGTGEDGVDEEYRHLFPPTPKGA